MTPAIARRRISIILDDIEHTYASLPPILAKPDPYDLKEARDLINNIEFLLVHNHTES